MAHSIALKPICVAALMHAAFLLPAQAEDFPEPLEAEPIPAVETLPDVYPDSWMIVHDFNFNSMVDGRLAVVDLAAEGLQLKGNVPASHFANFLSAKSSKELYVSETYYTRMVRGERNDVITIYDRDTLAFKDEIALPGGKRGQIIQLPNSFQFTNNEAWALVFNFTPASSVRVVDLKNRKILNEIDVPGCMLTFPTSQRGFSTMCSDGTLSTVVLDETGKVASQSNSEAFNDIDDDPLFMFPTQGDKVTHFLSYSGEVQTIDFTADKPKVLERWSLQQEGEEGWRPGGWQVMTSDASGKLYALMNPDGKEGSHKDGGTEVWVYDTDKKARISRIKLKGLAWSVGVSSGEEPLLVTASLDGSLNVYDARTGAHQRQLHPTTTYSPVAMFPAR